MKLPVLPHCLAIAAVLASLGAAAAQPVRVYHDETYWHVGYLDADKQVTAPLYHRLMCEALIQALEREGVEAAIVDAEGWLRLCREPERCIVVDICQTVPGIIYSGQDDGSPLESWLEAGGILCYSGDWPMFWYALAGEAKAGGDGAQLEGDDDVFDADLVKDGYVGVATTPTEEGKAVLPGLRPGSTMRPFDATAVAESCAWYEVYGRGERPGPAGQPMVAADPVCFRVPGGKGHFFAAHLRRGHHRDTNQLMLEFILNRGLELLRHGGEGR